jgi:hypothetical protein
MHFFTTAAGLSIAGTLFPVISYFLYFLFRSSVTIVHSMNEATP